MAEARFVRFRSRRPGLDTPPLDYPPIDVRAMVEGVIRCFEHPRAGVVHSRLNCSPKDAHAVKRGVLARRRDLVVLIQPHGQHHHITIQRRQA